MRYILMTLIVSGAVIYFVSGNKYLSLAGIAVTVVSALLSLIV